MERLNIEEQSDIRCTDLVEEQPVLVAASRRLADKRTDARTGQCWPVESWQPKLILGMPVVCTVADSTMTEKLDSVVVWREPFVRIVAPVDWHDWQPTVDRSEQCPNRFGILADPPCTLRCACDFVHPSIRTDLLRCRLADESLHGTIDRTVLCQYHNQTVTVKK